MSEKSKTIAMSPVKSGCKLVAVMNDNGADDAKWRDHRCTFEPCQKVGADKTAPEGNNAPHEGRPAALSPGVPLDAVVRGEKSALAGRQEKGKE